QRKGLTLTAQHDGAPTIVSDGDRLRRILENLVENAIKYTPGGGSVRIVTTARGGAAQVAGQDDGPGIPAEHLPRIFERFYRVDKARSRELGGTGLGLSIVRHLAESIGAVVSVESDPGRGAAFSVELPAPPLPPRVRPDPAVSEVEARAEVLRDHRARVRLAPEHAVAHARHEVVERVEEPPREHARDSAEPPPRRPEPAEDVDHGAAAG